MSEALEFLHALGLHLPDDERLVMCGFPGDPFLKEPHAWKPRPWTHGRSIPFYPDDNAYVTIASFKRAGDGTFRRRVDGFGNGLALMIDDVGTKVKHEAVVALEPNAIVETSPGNFQWWYFLDKPEPDYGKFDALIRGFIDVRLLGEDPGMSGVTRVGRIPGYVNGKPKYEGFVTRLTKLTDRRTTFEELLSKFKILLYGRRQKVNRITDPDAAERARAFPEFYMFLRHRGMLKKSDFDPSGWIEMECPWKDGHTGGVNTGAAIRLPAEENHYYGAFRCHHGHCVDRGWGDLTDWIDDTARQEVESRDEQYAKLMLEKMRCDRNRLASRSMKRYFAERVQEFKENDQSK